jgi:glycosyltransferase involved in cell wall biosynthesis
VRTCTGGPPSSGHDERAHARLRQQSGGRLIRLACLSTDPGVPYGGAKGASVHLGEIVAALAREGAEVLVLAAGTARNAAPPDVVVEVLPGPPKGAPAADRLGFADALANWLEQRLRRFGADALYERLALHSAAGATVAQRLGIPHLVELNAPLLEEAARYRKLEEPELASELERATLSSADVVFAVSPPLAAYAARKGARRVEVLQNAAAIERFAEPIDRNGADPAAVFAGSLRPWHGIETIADAWSLLGRSAPSLLVIGDGPERGRLEEVGANVTGHVPPDRVPALLARAAIGLAPYSAGAPLYFSPLKLFDYLAAGLATIVADLPAVTDVVDSDTAVVIPRGDARALADAVVALSSDASERERLGRNGRALVEAAHTWRHRARRILATAARLAANETVSA